MEDDKSKIITSCRRPQRPTQLIKDPITERSYCNMGHEPVLCNLLTNARFSPLQLEQLQSIWAWIPQWIDAQ